MSAKADPRSVRTTIRLSEQAVKKAQALANAYGRTLATQINLLLMDATGCRGFSPCILKSGDEYIWVSTYGTYGTLSKRIWKRFLAGGLPIESKDRWDEVFDDMDAACKSLGKEVCRQSNGGLVVTDLDNFIHLYNLYA